MEIRRATILGFTLLLLGLAIYGVGLWLLLSPAQYRATTRIILDDSDIIGMSGPPHDPSVYDPYFIQTEFEALQSQLVLSNVINALNLNVEWGEKYSSGQPLKTAESLKILRNRLRLALVRNTKLISISVFSENPDEAARIANAIAKAYQDYRVEKRRQEILKGLQVLQQDYQDLENNIQIRQTNVDLLREKLKIQNDTSPPSFQPSPTLGNISIADLGVGTNALAEQPYWEAKRKLENMLDFHKVLQAKIAALKLDLQIPTTTMVQIVDAAQRSELPASPNRFLGAVLLAIGLFPAVGGLLLLKSSRQRPFSAL
jgi:uncharacterized protein involved in exopolysaccharide biosynthesis